MPMTLDGSCRCGTVTFRLQSHTPVPYQRCYCSVCRKTAGGGYAINLGGIAGTLEVEGEPAIAIYRASLHRGGVCEISSGERNYCTRCASALWLFDPTWPDLIHPFASAIDTELPTPPARVHLMLKDKPDWIEVPQSETDDYFDRYPDLSLDDWHKKHGLWVD